VILGLAGPNASGKGEVASYLASLGYELHSLSDVVREEARRAGLGVERESLILTGNRLRREEGAGALALRILPQLGARAAVDSIRHPEEVAVLRGRPDFRLIGVDAPVETRFERARLRGRPGDPQDLEAFRAMEDREQGREPAGQDLAGTFALADHVLSNEGSLERLRARVDALLEELRDAGLEV
jgi:dephospho-CoA kinase